MLATCRAHPIRTAAIIGALVGLIQVLVLEIGGVLHHNSRAVLLLLAPFSTHGAAPTQQSILRTTILLFIEFTATILADALVFAIPVALIVLVVRASRRLSR